MCGGGVQGHRASPKAVVHCGCSTVSRGSAPHDSYPWCFGTNLKKHYAIAIARFISAGDFCHAVREVAPGISIATAENAFRQIDCDRDGRVSYRDFEVGLLA